ncbi:hypothetical protein Tco_0232417 [Tanacetum coccineum]
MALLLAEERFLKIKQVVEEEQNQPEVMQELLLKLMNDLQILKGIQPKQAEQEEQAAKSFTSYGNFSMIDDVKVLQDRENLMKDIQTFLRKFSRIPFGEIPKVLLIAWERFSEIKHAFTDKQYQQEDIQELMSKLLEDVKPKAITPDLPTEEPDNSLTMGDEHLNTIPEMEKSSVENLVPIPSEFKGISDDICDVPSCDNDHFDAEFGLINSLLSRDISITSPKIDFLPEEFAEDEILREKLLNVNLLVDKIEALKLTPSIPFVLENPSSSPIPVGDSDFLIEEVDTFLVPEDSIPPGIESDLDSEGDIVLLDNLLNEDPIPEYESFTFDIEPDAPMIKNFDELNEDECFRPSYVKVRLTFPQILKIRIFALSFGITFSLSHKPCGFSLLLSTGVKTKTSF